MTGRAGPGPPAWRIELFQARCRGELGYPAVYDLPGYTNARGQVLGAMIGAADENLTTAPLWRGFRNETGLDRVVVADAIEWLVTVGLAEPVDRRDYPGAPSLPGEVWRLLLVTEPPPPPKETTP